MTTNKIEELLKLLKDNKLETLKYELTTELLKSTDKASANLFTAVKRYLAKTDKSRPVLQTIQNIVGKQFIVNGSSAYIFDKYLPALETLPNTNEEEKCFNIFKLLSTSFENYTQLDYHDYTILRNIKKYMVYVKSLDKNTLNNIVPVYWNGKLYDAHLLAEAVGIMGLEDLEIAHNNGFTILRTNSIRGLIMPLNIAKNIEEKAKQNTEEFLIKLED